MISVYPPEVRARLAERGKASGSTSTTSTDEVDTLLVDIRSSATVAPVNIDDAPARKRPKLDDGADLLYAALDKQLKQSSHRVDHAQTTSTSFHILRKVAPKPSAAFDVAVNQAPKPQRSAQIDVRLSSPEMDEVEKQDHRRQQHQALQADWRNHPTIKNPAWVQTVGSNPSRRKPAPVLAYIGVLSDRPLLRALQGHGFELIEREHPLHGTHLVVSPHSAVHFATTSQLQHDLAQIFDNINLAITYFKRVLLIIELVPYATVEKAVKAQAEEGRAETIEMGNPLTPENIKEISSFKQGIAAINGARGKSTGECHVVFAANGADEVAGLMSGVTGQDVGRINRASGKEMLGDRSFLSSTQVKFSHSRRTRSPSDSG